MLKRCDFRARRKEGCESVSLMLTGRLFQMSGPQTEKARRPNWVLVRRTTADLVVDRSWRRWGPLTLNVTRSLRYGGERLRRVLCMIVATLKMMRNFIGSQWSCLRAGVIWDRRIRPRMSRAAAFWTRWRGASVDTGRKMTWPLAGIDILIQNIIHIYPIS